MDCPGQMLLSPMLDTIGSLNMVSVRFTTESQPADVLRVALYVPGLVSTCPFQFRGNCARHLCRFSCVVAAMPIFNDRVAMESQPFDPVNVTL